MSSKKNILMMLESQVDKIVLTVIILISLVLLWLYVLGNPYAVSVSGQKVGPGQIDKVIQQKADRLVEELDKLPSDEYAVFNETYLADFNRQLQCPIAEIPAELVLQFPGVGDAVILEDRLYDVPVIPSLSEVQLASLRGAARVPVDEVGPGKPYQSAETKLSDMDLVTVSGRFDVQSLYNSFRLSFDGPGLKSSWKDPELATPVFAKIQLQRRTQSDDGSWSDWQPVPRTKIDMYRKLLSELPLTADQMQFGVNVWMSQFRDPAVQLDILQPESYLFEISEMAWMPPEYLEQSRQILEKEKELEKRRLLEERQRASRTDRGTDRRGGMDRQPQGRQRQGDRARETTRPTDPTATRPGRDADPTLQDVERQVQMDLLTEVSRLSATREPVLVWAHDDTAEPGRSYQYRIRLGVFNPIMGKDWFKQSQAEFKDQTVLWSAFSEPTDTVAVAKMQHVFPMEVLSQKDTVATARGVKVEVAQYHLGQWRRTAFDVYPGQVIGSPVSLADLEAETATTPAPLAPPVRPATTEAGEMVDFTTPFVMVDVLSEFTWGSRLRRSRLDQMLYADAGGLSQLPVGKSNWPKDVRQAYDTVDDAMNRDVEKFAPGRLGPQEEMMPMDMDDMMMF